MRKLKVAVSSSTQLHEFLRSEFDIVDTPSIVSYGDNIQVDIDLFLLIDGDISDSIENNIKHFCELSNIPIFGMRRYKKSLQYTYLKKFGINTPETFFKNISGETRLNYFSLVDILHKVNDNEEIVVKIESGARGIGQLLLTKNQFMKIMCEGKIYEEASKYEQAIKKAKKFLTKSEEYEISNTITCI